MQTLLNGGLELLISLWSPPCGDSGHTVEVCLRVKTVIKVRVRDRIMATYAELG